MKRVAKTRIGTYYTVFDLRNPFTGKIKILCWHPDFSKSMTEKYKIEIFTVKEALKSKTV